MPVLDERNEILSLLCSDRRNTCNTNRLAHIGSRHGSVINFLEGIGRTKVERAIISNVSV